MRQVFPHFRGFGVHGVAGRDESHNAARTHLIQRLCEEIVVNVKTELVVSPVVYLIVSKGDVADSHIVEITAISGFKASHRNVRPGIELLSDPAGDAVQFHAVQLAFLHGFRQHPEEITHTHGRLQDIASFETHVVQGLIDSPNDRGRSVVCVQGRSAGGGIFLRGQRRFQFFVFAAPILLVRVKGGGQAAPAHITR